MVEGAAPDLIQPVQVARALDSGFDLSVHPELLAANLLLRTDRRSEQRIHQYRNEQQRWTQTETAGSSHCTSDSTNYIHSWSSSRMALRFSKGYRRHPREPAAIIGALTGEHAKKREAGRRKVTGSKQGVHSPVSGQRSWRPERRGDTSE